MKEKINFPALVIGKSKIDKVNYSYLVADKRYVSIAFKDVLIVDVQGNCFDTEKVVQDGGFDFFYSIRLIGCIVRVKPILKQPVYKINIQELKNRMVHIIKLYPSNFFQISDTASLVDQVNSSVTFNELINLF